MSKKQILLFAIFLLVFGWNSNAQLFWKISGNGLSKTSYLFGTHHIIDKSKIKNFDKILEICGQTDAAVGEMVLNDPTLQGKLMQGAIMKEGTIKDLVSPEDYTLLDNEFKQLIGAGMDQLGKMKPMMLSTLYTIMVYMKTKNITTQPEAVDKLFQNKSAENGKKIMGLETVEDKIEVLFNKIPLKRQAELLVKGIKEKNKGLDVLDKLNDVYVSEDLKKIAALVKEEQGDMTDEEMAMFVDVRNNNWMKKLPALMNEQSCFIAVGCLHLTGETGLLNQLKKSGYKLEPVVL